MSQTSQDVNEDVNANDKETDALVGGIALTDDYVLIRDQWDPETIHFIPKDLAISALRLLALTQPPPRNGQGSK